MRKHFVIVPCLLLLAACATAPTRPPFDHGMNSTQLWNALMAGNQYYVDGNIAFPGLTLDRETTAPKQNPPVTILSCADSRVPPELAFYRTVGDLFVAREAGNVADEFTIASIEFAILNRYTRMIVVLGHEDCGAVVSAIKNEAPTDSLRALVDRIQDSFPDPHCTNPADPQCVKELVMVNTRDSVKELVAASPTIRTAVCGPSPTATLIPAYYNSLVSGRVEVIPWPTGDGPCVPRPTK
jgi:carbonic anhydrase